MIQPHMFPLNSPGIIGSQLLYHTSQPLEDRMTICFLAVCRKRDIREIKIRVYGKRERQKLPRDHDFPAIFHVCRLPFASSTRRGPVFAFINNVSIYVKFFNLSTTFTGLCLGLMLFYFIFYAK